METPLQYSCLENPLDRGSWQAVVHRVAESDMTKASKHRPIYQKTRFRHSFFKCTCNIREDN